MSIRKSSPVRPAVESPSPRHGLTSGATPRQSSLATMRRRGSVVLFAGGLAVCGLALYQPAEPPSQLVLTNATSGDTSGGTSGSASGGTSGSASGGTSGNASGGTSGSASGGTSGSSGQSSGASSGASSGSPGGIFSFFGDLVTRALAFLGGLISAFLGLLGLSGRTNTGTGGSGWWFF